MTNKRINIVHIVLLFMSFLMCNGYAASQSDSLTDEQIVESIDRIPSLDGGPAELVLTQLLVAFMMQPDHFLEIVRDYDEEMQVQVLKLLAYQVFVMDESDNHQFERIINAGIESRNTENAELYKKLKVYYLEASKTNHYVPFETQDSNTVLFTQTPAASKTPSPVNDPGQSPSHAQEQAPTPTLKKDTMLPEDRAIETARNDSQKAASQTGGSRPVFIGFGILLGFLAITAIVIVSKKKR